MSTQVGAGISSTCAGTVWSSGETFCGTITTDTPPAGGDCSGRPGPDPTGRSDAEQVGDDQHRRDDDAADQPWGTITAEEAS